MKCYQECFALIKPVLSSLQYGTRCAPRDIHIIDTFVRLFLAFGVPIWNNYFFIVMTIALSLLCYIVYLNKPPATLPISIFFASFIVRSYTKIIIICNHRSCVIWPSPSHDDTRARIHWLDNSLRSTGPVICGCICGTRTKHTAIVWSVELFKLISGDI